MMKTIVIDGGYTLALKTRVIFGDTDAMGIVYYGTYFRFFEMGRVELLRRAGIVYRELTERGIHLPVIEAGCRYLKPAKYDDELSVFVKMEEVRGARLKFRYVIEIGDERIVEGFTEHAFTDSQGKPVRPPHEIKRRLEEIADAK